MKKIEFRIFQNSIFLLLSDLDSNQDKRYQKPSYYLYTIGQSCFEIVILFRNRMQM